MKGSSRGRSNSATGSESWSDLREAARELDSSKQYVIFAAEVFRGFGRRMENIGGSNQFRFFDIEWNKFPDGTDNLRIRGFTPKNYVHGSNIIFLASFHNNDVTLSQFSVLIVLLQSFIESMTIVLPFYPVGTNER